MNLTSKSLVNSPYSVLTIVLLSLISVVGLAGCGGGGGNDDDEPIVNTVNAQVAGYYTGSADVKMADNTTDLVISDLRVFVHGSRIMAMGLLTDAANFVLYDITITSIKNDKFEATATVYKAAVNIATVDITGTIVEGTSLSGTFDGSGIANGTFTVTYDVDVNAKVAGLGVIGGTRYRGPINASSIDLRFDIDATGNVISSFPSIDAVKLANCNVVTGSSLTAISDENLYDLVFVLSGCDDATVDGNYTGFITTYDSVSPPEPDGFMLVAFSNGSFAGIAEILIN